MAKSPPGPQLRLAPEAPVQFVEPSSAANKSLPVHRWANWIAGFSGEFARSAIRQYLPVPPPDALVLDPFAGVGTTLLEACREGIDSVGFELNPFAALICKVKLAASDIDLALLKDAIGSYRDFMEHVEHRPTIHDISHNGSGDPGLRSRPPAGFKSRIPFFAPPVERKVLYTMDFLARQSPDIRDLFRVALASVMVDFSNYSYEPSLGSRPAAGKSLVVDAPVGHIVSERLRHMVEDIDQLQQQAKARNTRPRSEVHCTSFFDAPQFLKPGGVHLVVTSPPYLNNYHYIRNTRPQLFWMELVTSSRELKALEDANFGKFWQTVRGDEPVTLEFSLPELEAQITEIRSLNSNRGVYGGRGWANYVATYMNDLYKFCSLLTRLLHPGGTAVVVVGNSVIQGREIAVDRYLSQIAHLHRLSTKGLVRLRDRVGSSVVNTGARQTGSRKYPLYDAAVVLRWGD